MPRRTTLEVSQDCWQSALERDFPQRVESRHLIDEWFRNYGRYNDTVVDDETYFKTLRLALWRSVTTEPLPDELK